MGEDQRTGKRIEAPPSGGRPLARWGRKSVCAVARHRSRGCRRRLTAATTISGGIMPAYDLVFEGGGAKGSVFVGALEVFYGAGHRPARLIGTSAGAITAAFIAAGYTPAEMLAAVTEQRNGKPRFATFMDPPVA